MKFPKTERLLTRREFQKLGRGSHSVAGSNLIINFRATPGCSKLGLTVTKRYGKAHDRNRFKRLIREIFRQMPKEEGLKINVRPRPAANLAPFSTLQMEFISLVQAAHTQQRTAKSSTRN
ncbi:MAG: ribonuclease P protein component [Simkaniaceae bacterium]